MSDPLDENLAALLNVAPPRARLDQGASQRIADALREAASGDGAPVHEASTPRTARVAEPRGPRPIGRPLRWTAIAAAAAAVILVLGALLRDPGTPSPGEEQGGRVADVAKPEDGAPGAGEEGPTAGNGERMAAGGADGPTEEPIASTDPRRVRGLVRLGEGMAAAPEAIDVWVRPLVDLPRVADARLHRVDWTADSDETSFALADALGGADAMGTDRVVVYVTAPGAGSVVAVAEVGPEGTEPVELELTAEWSSAGYVTDARTGAPIEGAMVIAVDQVPLDAIAVHPEDGPEVPTPSTTTDAAGRYVLGGLRRGTEARLRASAPGYAPAWVTARAAVPGQSTELEADLALDVGGGVSGVVERPDGTRWQGAMLIASRQDFHPIGPKRPPLTFGAGWSDAEGNYRIEDLPAGTYVVLLFDGEGENGQEPLAIRMTGVRGQDFTQVDFLGAGSPVGDLLSGKLLDEEGRPMPGRSVTLSRSEARSEDETGWTSVTTEDDGSFSFAGVLPGAYTLLMADDGFARFTALWSGEVDGSTTIEVSLARGSAVLRCRSADGSTLPPVPGAWALLERYSEDRERWEFSGFGRSMGGPDVTLSNVMDGRYRGILAPFSESLALASVPEFVVSQGGRVSVDVDLSPGTPIEVLVTDGGSNEPLEGVLLQVFGPDGREIAQQDPRRTDVSGRAKAQGIPLGTVTLRLSRKGKKLLETQVEVTRGGPGTLEPLPLSVR